MTGPSFGLGAMIAAGVFLVALVVTGFVARGRRQSESLGEFYLAGRSLGPLVLLLTLYATQYSGNALIGYPGEAYRSGFAWVMSVGFMTAVIVVYLVFAPQLYRLSRPKHFITPGDWIDHRFGSPALTLISNLVFLFAMINYLLAQLIAMGHITEVLSGQVIPFWAGVVALGLIVLIYETVGGMRAVAWTDCAQGIVLLLGLVGILIAVVPGVGGLREVSTWVIEHQPERARVPGGEVLRTWASSIVLIGFAAAVYPQAIQRIFAARDTRTLKRSLSVMSFMPLFTVLPVFLVGILAIPTLDGLDGVSADRVMPLMLAHWSGTSTWLYVMSVALLIGALAAIMSTADSVLLSLSSIISKDIIGRHWMKTATQEKLTQTGKRISWLLMLVLVIVALSPKITLWGLTELKMEMLVQTAPVFVLATLWPRMRAKPAIGGMLIGLVIAIGLTLAGYGKIWGIHAGVLGLVINVATCAALSSTGVRHPIGV
jgi:SSS family solute:Na+ symporter